MATFAAGLVQRTKTPESRKHKRNTNSPTWARKCKISTKWPKTTQLLFFVYFRGPIRGVFLGVFFLVSFVYSGFRGFCLLYQACRMGRLRTDVARVRITIGFGLTDAACRYRFLLLGSPTLHIQIASVH